MGLQAYFPGNLSTGASSDQCIEAMRQAAFWFFWKALEEHRSCDQSQDAVPQKFEPLVVRRTRAAMGQRLFEQSQVGGRCAYDILKPG